MRTDRKAAKARPAIHRESLLNVPLVASMFDDPTVRVFPRAIDRRWMYNGLLTRSPVGFRPFEGFIMYGATSRYAEWRKRPEASARAQNPKGELVNEVLGAVHDWLHVWSYGLIRRLAPHLEFGYGRITKKNFEGLVFAHLMTEAVATIALDYWFLCKVDINSVCPIGTTLTRLIQYDERNLAEYRRAWPDLDVHRPQFLFDIIQFYCDGVLRGVNRDDLVNSPVLLAWLHGEVEYMVLQRRYVRSWLAYLAGMPALNDEQLDAPVECSKPWQRKLMSDISEASWALTHHSKREATVEIDPGTGWKRPASTPPIPFLVNLNTFSDDDLTAAGRWATTDLRFDTLMYQFVQSYDFDHFGKDFAPVLKLIRQHRDFDALRAVFRGAPKVKPVARDDEPSDMMFYT